MITNKLCIGLLASLAILSCNVYAADNTTLNNQRTISANGHGEVTVPQTIAIMDFTINKTDDNAKDAQQSVRVASDKLLSALKTQSYLTLQTTGMNVSPVMSYKDGTSKVVGYTATYTVEVKTKIADAGKLMDKAIDNGANIMNNPQFTASDADRSKAQLDAIAQATINAKAQADASLNAIGLKAGAIKQITVAANNQPTPPAPRMALMRVSANAMPATTVEAGVDTVSADVNLVIAY